MIVAETLLGLLVIYVLFGLGFALWFLTRGVARLDPAAGGTGVVLRLLLVPGTVALWPLLLIRWRQHAQTGGSP